MKTKLTKLDKEILKYLSLTAYSCGTFVNLFLYLKDMKIKTSGTQITDSLDKLVMNNKIRKNTFYTLKNT